MRKIDEYFNLKVESFRPITTAGLHGEIHIRPSDNQTDVDCSLHVAGTKQMSYAHPVGTKFQIRAKLTHRKGKGYYYYTSYQWGYKLINE